MASAVSVDQAADRAALSQEARRLADELESLSAQLQKIDAVSAIRRFMVLHSVGNPNFEMLNAAKNLRAYAGILSALTASMPKASESPANPTRLELLRKRIERRRSPRKRGQQIHRVAVTI